MNIKRDFNSNPEQQTKFVRRVKRPSFLRILFWSVVLAVVTFFLSSLVNIMIFAIIDSTRQQLQTNGLWFHVVQNFEVFWSNAFAMAKKVLFSRERWMLNDRITHRFQLTLLSTVLLTVIIGPLVAYLAGFSWSTRNLVSETVHKEDQLLAENLEKEAILSFVAELGNRLVVIDNSKQGVNQLTAQQDPAIPSKSKVTDRLEGLNLKPQI